MARRSIAATWARALQRSAKALARAAARQRASALREAERNSRQAARAAAKAAARATRLAAKTTARAARQAQGRGGAAAQQASAGAGKMTGAVTGAVKGTLTGALRAAARQADPHAQWPAATGEWIAGVALGPAGMRRFHLYRPAALKLLRAGTAQRVPLVVMLHGCTQAGRAFAASTRMHRLADRYGFLVVYPEQDTLAHPQGCWRWYELRAGHAQAESQTLLAMVDQLCLRYPVDRQRVALAGISAGAGLAALMATRDPERYAAVVMHSGVAPGSARSTATALQAMHGHGHAELPEGCRPPPLLVLQGLADRIVAPSNGRMAAEAWAQALGALPALPKRMQRGARHPMTVTDFRKARQVVVRLCEIDGLGHAWSGGDRRQHHSDAAGPDASRLAWAFMQAAFARRG